MTENGQCNGGKWVFEEGKLGKKMVGYGGEWKEKGGEREIEAFAGEKGYDVVVWSEQFKKRKKNGRVNGGARPPPCNPLTHDYKSTTASHIATLISALFFKSIGAGGFKPCSMPFGADQLTNKNERSWRAISAAASLGGSFGLTLVVHIIRVYGWNIGYGTCAFLMLLSTPAFYIAAPFYIE
ncbi:hypothetical protein F3Y22_tig00110556pilonHSYRG00569 [Hibiscus syriacus]|uniref:Uncharacterized protein n=1 Tax=Hibiscus syriacus TaxID=106335 RepID=A0A6A3ACN8_HIBSY|nr:hypothetical protein F3Y22_tig00110556pilonHSYRG00569 [Hibiscus syriacus]